jgi:hypothetical protein
MKIGCWKQLRFSCQYPSLALYLLALRAMAIPARVVAHAYMATPGAQIDMATHGCGTASPDGIQCAQLPGVKLLSA